MNEKVRGEGGGGGGGVGSCNNWYSPQLGVVYDAHIWLAYVWDRVAYNWQPV